MSISAIAKSGSDPTQFTLSSVPSLPATVTPGNSVQFMVAFAPLMPGANRQISTLQAMAATRPCFGGNGNGDWALDLHMDATSWLD